MNGWDGVGNHDPSVRLTFSDPKKFEAPPIGEELPGKETVKPLSRIQRACGPPYIPYGLSFEHIQAEIFITINLVEHGSLSSWRILAYKNWV
jgi:hypothetical protein